MKVSKRIFILLTFLLLLISVTGCSGDREDAVIYDDSLIKEVVSEEGEYRITETDGFRYSYHIPNIISDSEDAGRINKEINDAITAKCGPDNGHINAGDVKYSNVSWKSYWNEGLLSLVIRCGYPFVKDEVYVYNFDFEEEKRLDNDDIIKRAGIDKKEFADIAVRSAVKDFDDMFSDNATDTEALNIYYSYMLPLRFETARNADPENMKLVYDGDCLKCMAECVAPRAMTGWEYRMYDILPASGKTSEKVSDKFITAELDKGRVSFTFRKDKEADSYLEWNNNYENRKSVKFGKKYYVNGLCSDYRALFIGVIGQDYMPYLILTTESGNLEFINILECARYGRFAAVPVPGISDVKTVYSDVVEDVDANGNLISSYNTIFAERTDGKRLDLSKWILTAERSSFDCTAECTCVSDAITHGLDSQGDYESVYFIDFNENGDLDIDDVIYDVDIEMHYDGYHILLGMTDNGIAYGYTISSEEYDDFYKGIFEIRYDHEDGDDHYGNSVINIRSIAGTDIFDSDGEWIDFHIAK